MITHYDMVTGELIAEETGERNDPLPIGVASLRLLSVEEATAGDRPERRFPAAVVLAAPGLFDPHH